MSRGLSYPNIRRKVRKSPCLTCSFISGSIFKSISAAVRRAGISRLFGAQGSINVQGEEQQMLDILANQVFINYLRSAELSQSLLEAEHKALL